jgi:hypothetical protein
MIIFLFVLLVQREFPIYIGTYAKKTPENDNSPFSGWFPDLTDVLL